MDTGKSDFRPVGAELCTERSVGRPDITGCRGSSEAGAENRGAQPPAGSKPPVHVTNLTAEAPDGEDGANTGELIGVGYEWLRD